MVRQHLRHEVRKRPFACSLALVFALCAAAQPPARADRAGELVSKYIAWRGGAAFENLQAIHERGRIRIGEVDGTFERWLARDGRMREDRSLGPLADSTAVTAEASWTVNASGQLEEPGDHGLAARRAIALYFADPRHPRPGMTVRWLGIEQREDRAWNVVRISFGDNDSFDLFIDASTGELLGERTTQDRVTRFTRYGDWRRVGGMRFAFEQRSTGADPHADEIRHLESVEADPALAAGLFTRPAPKQAWSFANGRGSTGWLAFEFYNNDQIFVPARVNGHAVDVVLDSGADISILDKSVAGQIGATLSGSVPVGGTGGQSTMQLAPGIEVRIGDLELHGLTVGVMDLATLANQLGRPLPMILGKEVFNQLVVDIDFPNRRIAFQARAGFEPPAGAVRVPLGRHGENRTVPLAIEQRPAVDFDFDLGSNSPLIIYPYYRDSTQLLAGRRQSRELSSGVGGLFRPVCATLQSITIAGLRLEDVPADFPDPANSALNSDRMGGNVGLPVFSRFRLITDYAQDAIWLAADPGSKPPPFPRNRAGIIALPAGDRLKILMVAPGSPAEHDGWKEGMEIVAIDGHKIDAAYRNSAMSRWATQPAGTRVTLTLADESRKVITLADYF